MGFQSAFNQTINSITSAYLEKQRTKAQQDIAAAEKAPKQLTERQQADLDYRKARTEQIKLSNEAAKQKLNKQNNKINPSPVSPEAINNSQQRIDKIKAGQINSTPTFDDTGKPIKTEIKPVKSDTIASNTSIFDSDDILIKPQTYEATTGFDSNEAMNAEQRVVDQINLSSSEITPKINEETGELSKPIESVRERWMQDNPADKAWNHFIGKRDEMITDIKSKFKAAGKSIDKSTKKIIDELNNSDYETFVKDWGPEAAQVGREANLARALSDKASELQILIDAKEKQNKAIEDWDNYANEIMNDDNKFNALSEEEKAEFLNKLAYGDETGTIQEEKKWHPLNANQNPEAEKWLNKNKNAVEFLTILLEENMEGGGVGVIDWGAFGDNPWEFADNTGVTGAEIQKALDSYDFYWGLPFQDVDNYGGSEVLMSVEDYIKKHGPLARQEYNNYLRRKKSKPINFNSFTF